MIEERIMSHHGVFVLFMVVIASVHSASLVRTDLQHFDGRNISSIKQCQTRGFMGACTYSDPADVCLHMKCSKSVCHLPLSVDVGPALQETWCGEDKICISGLCTDDPVPPPKPSTNPHDIVIKGFLIPCIELSN